MIPPPKVSPGEPDFDGRGRPPRRLTVAAGFLVEDCPAFYGRCSFRSITSHELGASPTTRIIKASEFAPRSASGASGQCRGVSAADALDPVAFARELGFDKIAVIALNFDSPVLDRSAAAQPLLEAAEKMFLKRRMKDETFDARDPAALASALEREPQGLRLAALDLGRVGADARRAPAGRAKSGVRGIDRTFVHASLYLSRLQAGHRPPERREIGVDRGSGESEARSLTVL